MAGVGKKLLNLFIEVENEPDIKKEDAGKRKTVANAAPEPNRTVPVNVSAGTTDDAIAKNIADALEKANLSGFDYFEYAKTLDALKTTIPAEQTLYQTAFASGTVMGAGKKSLLDSANHYITVLDKEAEKFAVSVQQRIQQTVTVKEEQVRSIEKTINEKAAQIQKLTNEINALSNEKNTVVNVISENRVKIEKVRNDFAATLQVFLGKIRGDIEKIQKYIAG